MPRGFGRADGGGRGGATQTSPSSVQVFIVSQPFDRSQSSSEPATHRPAFRVQCPTSLHIEDCAQCSGFDGAHAEPWGEASHCPSVPH